MWLGSVTLLETMTQFDASVIIPTFNRCASLLRTLESIARQDVDKWSFEVIVVDDGSIDETSNICQQPFPYNLRYLRQENQGSAKARNAGAESAVGNILIFLDDDMIAEPGYMSGLLEEHRMYPHIVAMGIERPCLIEPASFYTHIVVAERERHVLTRQQGVFVNFTACVTNNLSVEREDFIMVGAMQDTAGDGPTWWGDVDFGYRAFKKGMQFRRSGRAVCRHCDYSIADFATSLVRAEKASYLVHHLICKYPDISCYLPMFQDKSPIDWRADGPAMIARKMTRKAASTGPAVIGLEAVVHQLEQFYPKPAVLRPLYRWITGAYIYRGYRRGLRELNDRKIPDPLTATKTED